MQSFVITVANIGRFYKLFHYCIVRKKNYKTARMKSAYSPQICCFMHSLHYCSVSLYWIQSTYLSLHLGNAMIGNVSLL